MFQKVSFIEWERADQVQSEIQSQYPMANVGYVSCVFSVHAKHSPSELTKMTEQKQAVQIPCRMSIEK